MTRESRNIAALLILSFFLVGIAPLATDKSPFFRDRREMSGIDFRLNHSPTSERYLIETMTGGCAFLDYDGDGLLDVFLVNGAEIRRKPGMPPKIDKSGPQYWNRLYHNLGDDRFEDVTKKAGAQGRGYGMGVAVGDYDNDGWPDLYVTNYGENELLHNQGDGTFREVTATAGVVGGGFSASAAFFDYDRDGLLDLYVCRYLDWSFDNNPACHSGESRDYCHPRHFQGVPDLLFQNQGDGTFTDVSKAMGVGLATGKGLGVAISDFDRDGWPDVYVANDQVPSFLFRNREGKSVQEIGLEAAAGLNESGLPFAGMGVDFADYNNDGWPDVFVTALSLEGFVLFRNNQDGTFDDVSEGTGIRKASWYLSGWGTKLVDFDNDGWKDLFIANGHVARVVEKAVRTLSYTQPPLMLKNTQKGFADVTESMGPAFQRQWAARGAAFGDFDNDGDVDILVQVLGGAPLLLENTEGNKKQWLGLKLIGTMSNRDAIGAVVKVAAGNGKEQHYTVGRSASYLSSSDPRILVGLGDQTTADLEITWPSGTVQRVLRAPSRSYLQIRETEPPRNSDSPGETRASRNSNLTSQLPVGR